MLGPSLLGKDLSESLFPTDQRDYLSLLASIGLVLFMFVVGLELDVKLVQGRGRVALSVSITSILLPFALGFGLANLLDDSLRGAEGDGAVFGLFVGAAMSITAFPVLARILTDRRMHRTETGGVALACAATDDVLAWTLLAVVIGIAGGEHGKEAATHGPSWVILLAVPFALLAIFVVRPMLTRLTQAYLRAGELTPQVLSVVLVGLLAFAAATEWLGVHFIFGAFLFGAIMPHDQAAAMRHEILVRLEQISVLLLLPVFFLVSGLKVDIRGLGTEHILPLVAILAVAIVGKYVGAYVGARSAGVPHWQANALGILMNTRGLTELVILSVGLPAQADQRRDVHDDGDHGARHDHHDRPPAQARLPGAARGPRHRRGRAPGPRRRGARPGAGRRPPRPRQHAAGRPRRRVAPRWLPPRDRRRRVRGAVEPPARARQRAERRARRDGGDHGAPAGPGQARRGHGHARADRRQPERRRPRRPARAGRRDRPSVRRRLGRRRDRCRGGRGRRVPGRARGVLARARDRRHPGRRRAQRRRRR